MLRVVTKHYYPHCVSHPLEGVRRKRHVASSVSVSGLSDNPGNQERARHTHKKWAWEKLA